MATWHRLNHSRTRVRKAGDFLLRDYKEHTDGDSDRWLEEHSVLSNWRAAHAYPMHAVLMLVRGQMKRAKIGGLVVQRLKRVESIINKLARPNGLKLDRIQDIAGCRVILKRQADLQRLRNQLSKCGTSHVLVRTDDYLANPKPTGYRGVHLIYRYRGTKHEYRDLVVELQLRTEIQHAWATAVEIVGTFTRQALKASVGDPEWLDFFVCAGAEFAKREGCDPGPHVAGRDTHSDLVRLAEKLNAPARLSAFAITTRHLEQKASFRPSDFVLLQISWIESGAVNIEIRRFKRDQLEAATTAYKIIEQQRQAGKLIDGVLVSAQSLQDLRKAFPNYFADSKDFRNLLHSIIFFGDQSPT